MTGKVVLIALLLFLGGCSRKSLQIVVPKAPRSVQSAPKDEPKVAPTAAATKAKRQYLKKVRRFQKRAAKRWGSRAKVASRYEYVKYSEDFKARAIINFQTGLIRVESTAEKEPLTILKKVIRTTLLNPLDPQKVDLFSDRDRLQKGEPFLYNKVFDDEREPIRWVWRAERYADYLIGHAMKKDRIRTGGGEKTRYSVSFRMSDPKHYRSDNAPYRHHAEKNAKKFGISTALIMGVIQTESHFNPFATSAIPAYGLMQVVPSSAGADAWRYLKGKRGRPSSRYLFNAANNIELGSAYLMILLKNYLGGIKNAASREYCAIAAYNTGSGNVLRSFSKNRDDAVRRINGMSPREVFAHLRQHLPFKETRDYLAKVVRAKKAFY